MEFGIGLKMLLEGGEPSILKNSKRFYLSPQSRLFLLLIVMAIVATHRFPLGWNDASRLSTIQSLVERHTFVIDQSSFYTGDKVSIGGHFYSDKPPLPALLGAAVYFPLYHLGVKLNSGGLACYLITLLSVGVCWIVGTLAFFRSLEYTNLDGKDRLPAAISFGFGTIYLSWATTFNNHELAAAFLAIGFLFFLRAKHGMAVGVNLCLAGAFLSLAGAADIPSGVFYPVFLALILCTPMLRRDVSFYLTPLAATVAPTLIINYSIHRSIMPVQIVRSYFQYPGSPWIGSSALSGMSTNDAAFTVKYALSTFIGPHGFLLYNPLLFMALWGLLQTIRQRQKYFWEGIGVAAASAGLIGYYLMTTSNYGGWSYSIRWFVPLLPMLMFFLFSYDGRRGRYFGPLFKTLLAISVIIAAVGTVNPWAPVTDDEVPFLQNLSTWIASVT